MAANKNRLRVVCVIFNGNTRVVGVNSHSKTNPNCVRIFDDGSSLTTLHAEYHAISKLQIFKINPKKLKVYIFRRRLDGFVGMARPCPMCQRKIEEVNIPFSNVYYSDYDGNFRRLSSDNIVDISGDNLSIIENHWEEASKFEVA